MTAGAKRTRTRGEFSHAVDALEVGQGFEYDGTTKKAQYSRVSPGKFGGKKFQVWQVFDENGQAITRKGDDDKVWNRFGVRRLS